MKTVYLQKKKDLLEKFFSISFQIEEWINKGETETIEDLFRSREQLILQINEMDQQVDPLIVDTVKKELTPLVQKMLEQEERLKHLLTLKKAQAQEEIKKLNLSKKMSKTYQQTPYATDGIFFDKTINPNK